MSKINFGGESYKIRQREVDGKKQEIYYKDGEAFVKTSDGKLEKLNKLSDGIFNKASYTTQAFDSKIKENYADSLNSRYTDENRPKLEGKVDANNFTHSPDFVGYKGRFVDENDKGFNGIVFRDKESNENRVLAQRNFENGSSQKNVYAMNPDSGKFFLESRTIQNADGAMTIRKFNYDTGEYDLVKNDVPKIVTPEVKAEDENKLYAGGRLSEVVITGKAPKQKGSPENTPNSSGFEISTNFADYPKGKEALKNAVNISGLNAEQLADVKDGTAVKVVYTGKDGKAKVIGGIMAGGNFTAPVDRTADGKCYVGVFDPSKLITGNNQLDLQNSKIKTLEPKDELLANND